MFCCVSRSLDHLCTTWTSADIVHHIAQVLQYSKSRKHIGPLWFSTISTNIMWWTYVKAFWRAVISAMGFQRIQFKTTLKVRTVIVNIQATLLHRDRPPCSVNNLTAGP